MKGRHALLILLTASVAGSLPLLARQEPRFRYQRTIQTQGSGPRRLAVDVTLLSGGAPFKVVRLGEAAVARDGLRDLRLFAPGGRQVPYLLVQARAEPDWRSGRILPIAATKVTSGFDVDFGSAQSIDRVRVAGIPGPFLKRLRLEGSGDRSHWTLLQAEGTLFDLPDERISNTDLSFPAGAYRYVRVTWNDANSGRVPPPATVLARSAPGIPAPPAAATAVAFEQRPSEPGRSRYRLRLPAAQLPIVALDLDVGNPYVHREASVSEARFTGTEAGPALLGTAGLVRVVQSGTTAEALRIPITIPSEQEIDLVVQDDDNPPLDLRRVRLIFAELPWIYFESSSPTVVARYGDHAVAAPRYDLEAVRESVDLENTREARWAPALRLSAAAPEEPAAPPAGAGSVLEDGFRYARPLTGVDRGGGLMAIPLDAAALAHSLGPASRFADIRIVDQENRQVPYLLERRDEPLSIGLTLERESSPGVPPLPPAAAGSRSIYRVALPQAGLPAGTITVTTSARVFQRAVQIGTIRPPNRTRRDSQYDVLGSATWRHADERAAAPALTLPVPAVEEHVLWLVVDEGDNAPLPLEHARLLLPSFRLRFFAPPGGGLRLVYGRDDLQPPRYDLSLLAPRVMGAAATEIAAGPEVARADRVAFISPRWFWILLGASVAALLALIARLARRAG
jgi:hypothetical protein